ncbi:hypothetical protein O3G_MSEX006332 [Manduca sexta]|uniref:ATP synthase subunit d, mitochondrial n=1 Tax=Manduca sexta TaxID=7130 RepID=A0A922CLN6_MANSE|nr:hypothetical protein O3G_MSEX006332 [Manduca sexta]
MAKRFTKSAINWTEFQNRVPPEQQSNFMSFKSKYEMYVRRMKDNPAEPPKINWDIYKQLIPVPGLVDKLKSDYEAFKVPFPQDPVTAKIDEQWKTVEAEIKKYCADVQKDIEAAKKELERIKALPKFDEMTMETYYDMYPEYALDFVKKPTFWPHTPEEQEGYEEPSPGGGKEH